MGSLTLPDSGSIYLDANGFIYSVEHIEPYAALLKPVWQAAADRDIQVVSSELVILETLVKPLREEDNQLVKIFEELLFNTREVQLVPTTADIWEDAARIRAASGLKTPDAIHAASALASEAALLLTNDPHFRRLEALPVVILDELLEETDISP